MNQLDNHIVLLSGGMDSTVLLSHVVSIHGTLQTVAVSFNYGQRHVRELEAAAQIAEMADVRHIVFNIVEAFGQISQFSQSSLLFGSAVPSGLYDEKSMASTIVPNRNMIMLSLAAGLADALALQNGNKSIIYLASHAGDHFIYPDCRPEFNDAVAQSVGLATEDRVSFRAPFSSMTKDRIAYLGTQLNAPLYASWSCYNGGEVHCGRCGTCTERIEAFWNAKVPDTSIYDPAGYEFAIQALTKEGKIVV